MRAGLRPVQRPHGRLLPEARRTHSVRFGGARRFAGDERFSVALTGHYRTNRSPGPNLGKAIHPRHLRRPILFLPAHSGSAFGANAADVAGEAVAAGQALARDPALPKRAAPPVPCDADHRRCHEYDDRQGEDGDAEPRVHSHERPGADEVYWHRQPRPNVSPPCPLAPFHSPILPSMLCRTACQAPPNGLPRSIARADRAVPLTNRGLCCELYPTAFAPASAPA